MRLLIYLTPFRFYLEPHPPLSPFPLARGRGNGNIREAKPLFDSPIVSVSLKGEGEEILERGEAPLLPLFPLPLLREGGQGDRFQ